MNKLTIHDELEQGSDEWLAARRGILTASVIGKLITPTLKVADNETSRGVLYTLAAERITGLVDYVHPTFDMQRGTDDEPYARTAYAEKYAAVAEVGFVTLETPAYTLGYSPDGLVGDDGLIEIKSRKPKEHLKAILTGQVPAENVAQIQTGLFITGRAWIDYVSFSAGLPLWVKRIEPDPAWFDIIDATATAFEVSVNGIVDRFTTETADLAPTERRPDYQDVTF